METILFLAHTQENGQLPKLALEALAGAVKVSAGLAGSRLVVGLIGDSLQAAATAVSGSGAVKYWAVEGPEFNVSRYASDAAAAEALVKASSATIVVAPGTARFSRAMPGAARRLNGRIDTHVSGIDLSGGQLMINRWYYRQRMVASMSRSQRPWFLLVDSGVFEAVKPSPAAVSLEKLSVALPDACKRTKVIGVEAPSAGTQTIRPDAALLFVAGAGWTKKQADGQIHAKDAEKLILDVLKYGKASLGSSKSLVDQGSEGEAVLSFMSHLNQVGQTGSTPRHPKGLSTCCHGEEPHVVGWRFINERRAVNLDANCGWAHGKTDVLYVADAFAVMAKVNELLSK